LSDSEQKNGRTCRFCGKSYSDDGRARAAYLRHVADCKDDGQTRLFQFALDHDREESR
jgi:hypothetical protein